MGALSVDFENWEERAIRARLNREMQNRNDATAAVRPIIARERSRHQNYRLWGVPRNLLGLAHLPEDRCGVVLAGHLVDWQAA